VCYAHARETERAEAGDVKREKEIDPDPQDVKKRRVGALRYRAQGVNFWKRAERLLESLDGDE